MSGANILKRTVYVGGLDEQVPFMTQAFLLLVVELFVIKWFRIDFVCLWFTDVFDFVHFIRIQAEQDLERHRKDRDIHYMSMCWCVFFWKFCALQLS